MSPALQSQRLHPPPPVEHGLLVNLKKDRLLDKLTHLFVKEHPVSSDSDSLPAVEIALARSTLARTQIRLHDERRHMPLFKQPMGQFPSHVLSEAVPKADEAENANSDHKWKCNEICSNTGAEAHFDEETLNCKCVVVANVDDAEMALIEKNMQLLNSHSEPNIEPSVIATNPRSRRHLSQNDNNKLITNTDTIVHDPTVGQAILARLPRQHHHSPGFQHTLPLAPLNPIQPVHHMPAPLLPQHHKIPQIPPVVAPPNAVYSQNPAIQKHLEKIRARVQELANRSNTRNARVNLETIRNHLKELRNRSGFANVQNQRAARTKAFQDRLERERKRIQQLQPLRPIGGGLFPFGGADGVVGAAAASVTSANSTTTALPPTKNKPHELNPKNPPNSVITQPKELVDEE
ncbi:hypothetical protein ILUMI_25733 [Ignelater luminosus]|uniref:Uncharacterized protein n=1 Tax=Ignelater luminosus TaxID=2038154 RepID=A0A8K0FW54_IGNLU|nr:hypothetical protein ILUMI_25733 [Ignelater luminosus]